MTIRLRPYQRDAVGAIQTAWYRIQRPAVVLPTGAGKTVVFAAVARQFREAQPRARALVVAHRAELIDQAARKLRDAMPGTRIGLVKAEHNDTLPGVLVGSVQTLRSPSRRAMLRDVGLVIVDEAHHATAQSYLQVLDHYGCMRGLGQGALALGVTATMSRGDEAALGEVWQDVVYTRSIAQMIVDGYLVRPHGKRIEVEGLDLARVRRMHGDYSERALNEALTDSLAPEAIADALAEHAKGRHVIIFAPMVETARLIGEAVTARTGLEVGVIWGDMPPADRKRTLARFEAGELPVLSSVMVLTEGFDAPIADCAVIARPTTHKGLYVQMVGRILRPHPGKSDALVLDVVGASQRHALATDIELFGRDVTLKGETEPKEVSDDDLALYGALDLLEPPDAEHSLPYVPPVLVATDVDLFHASASAWLRTRAGVWFLPAGERYIAILPSLTLPGGWDVCAMHSRQLGTGRWVIEGVSELSYAMAHAEGEVTPAEQVLAGRERSWRAKAPSDKQRALAARFAIPIMPGQLSGEVSNAITVAMASGRIDPIYRRTYERWRETA